MESRELKASEQAHYFEPVAQAGDIGEGTREMHPLYPFVVSGGKNTRIHPPEVAPIRLTSYSCSI